MAEKRRFFMCTNKRSTMYVGFEIGHVYSLNTSSNGIKYIGSIDFPNTGVVGYVMEESTNYHKCFTEITEEKAQEILGKQAQEQYSKMKPQNIDEKVSLRVPTNNEEVYVEKIWDVFIKANPNYEPMLSGNDQDKIEVLLKDYKNS